MLAIAAQIIAKPDSVLGLATGSTPIGTYKNLVAAYNAGDWTFLRLNLLTWTSTAVLQRTMTRVITTL